MTGRVTERWIADTTGLEDAPAGKIEIITAFVATEFEGDYLDLEVEDAEEVDGE